MKLKENVKLMVLLLLVTPLMLSAQTVTKSIAILNGGAYSNPDDYVTLATFDPLTDVTQTKATIYTQSVQGMLVHNGFAYIAAQDSLAKVELETGIITAVVAVTGVNKMAVYNDKLIVSRQFPVTSGFVQIRQIEDLSLLSTFDEISDESWEITVVGDSAYVSVAGGWAATEGKLAVLDMKNTAFIREINLGAQAQGIGPSFRKNDHIFFVCKTPWGGTTGTIVKYNIAFASYTLYQSEHVYGKAAGIAGSNLYLLINQNIGIIDLNTVSVLDETLVINPFADLDITALSIDTVSERIYVNYSYWIAPDGVGKIYDLNGNETGEYEVGISAEELAVNYTDVTSIPFNDEKQHAITIFPNPCFDQLTVTGISKYTDIEIFDIMGKQISFNGRGTETSSTIDVSALPPGVYFIKVSTFVKQRLVKFIRK